MNEKNREICQEIEEHLNDSMESNAQKLIKRDHILQSELDLFEQSLQPSQKQHWDLIRDQIDNMRRYAKLGKIRLMDSDENVSKLLVDYQIQFEADYKSKLEGSSVGEDENQAALQIHREMHEPSGVLGIFKSLFMWKDTPVERINGKKQK
jgi:hypothetical protein